MKYVSLFAGIGGFDYALTKLGHQCVYANEYDKYASSIFIRHFGHCDTRDIREVATDDIPDHDLLVGGFPCQAFSVAGKRAGFDDTRGTLFFDIARILKDKRPRYFLLENVKGLLTHDSGKTFSTILGVLTDLGYDYQWEVLNSKNFGVPQNRERVLIAGSVREQSRPEVFPLTKDEGLHIQQTESGQGQSQAQLSTTKADSTFIISQEDRPRIVARNQRNEIRTMDIAGSLTKDRSAKQFSYLLQPKIVKVQGDLDKRKVYLGDLASTLAANPTSDNTARVLVDGDIRRLTPIECERLQGFPDNWTEGLSDTQRYKCLGNAVTTNVIRAVIERMLL